MGHAKRDISASAWLKAPGNRNIFPTMTVRENWRWRSTAIQGKRTQDRLAFERFPILAGVAASPRARCGGERQMLAMARWR